MASGKNILRDRDLITCVNEINNSRPRDLNLLFTNKTSGREEDSWWDTFEFQDVSSTMIPERIVSWLPYRADEPTESAHRIRTGSNRGSKVSRFESVPGLVFVCTESARIPDRARRAKESQAPPIHSHVKPLCRLHQRRFSAQRKGASRLLAIVSASSLFFPLTEQNCRMTSAEKSVLV